MFALRFILGFALFVTVHTCDVEKFKVTMQKNINYYHIIVANKENFSLFRCQQSFPKRNKIQSVAFRGTLRVVTKTAINTSNTKLRRAVFSNVDLHEIEPGSFTFLKHLKLLDLSSNKHLTSIDNSTFTGLNKLKSLNLSNCSIQTVTPSFFSKLQRLEILLLQANSITDLTSDASILKSINVLNLSHNNISYIHPTFFKSFPNLDGLDLQANRITTIDSGMFSYLVKLMHLNLATNRIRLLTSYGTFSNQSELVTLDISRNNLMKLEVNVLYSLSRLKKIYLDDNQLTTFKFRDLLKQLEYLTTVSVCNNPWSLETKEVIATIKETSPVKFSNWGSICLKNETDTPFISTSTLRPDMFSPTSDQIVTSEEATAPLISHARSQIVCEIVVIVMLIILLLIVLTGICMIFKKRLTRFAIVKKVNKRRQTIGWDRIRV